MEKKKWIIMGVITLLVAVGGFYMYRKQKSVGISDIIEEPGIPGIPSPDSGIAPSPEGTQPGTPKPPSIISELITQVPGILGALPGLISGIAGGGGGVGGGGGGFIPDVTPFPTDPLPGGGGGGLVPMPGGLVPMPGGLVPTPGPGGIPIPHPIPGPGGIPIPYPVPGPGGIPIPHPIPGPGGIPIPHPVPGPGGIPIPHIPIPIPRPPGPIPIPIPRPPGPIPIPIPRPPGPIPIPHPLPHPIPHPMSLLRNAFGYGEISNTKPFDDFNDYGLNAGQSEILSSATPQLKNYILSFAGKWPWVTSDNGVLISPTWVITCISAQIGDICVLGMYDKRLYESQRQIRRYKNVFQNGSLRLCQLDFPVDFTKFVISCNVTNDNIDIYQKEVFTVGWGIVNTKTSTVIAESIGVGDKCSDGTLCLKDSSILENCFTNCPVFINLPDINGVNTWWLVAFTKECERITKCIDVGFYWKWIKHYVTDY